MAALQLQALRAPAAAPPLRSSSSSSFCAPLSLPAPALAPRRGARATASARITMRFGVASKQAYICRDCGYIYNDRTPFDKLPDKYFCPVCGAPKRRFKPYEPKVAKNANATDARKARKEQLKKDESIGQALPIGIAVGILALAGLFFYLNSVY
uniref:Rubredoxin-like domain-containing protein n=1 Tax=Oryza punctata TaxID=4537 RepID=A0A0E0MFY4_ORYPU